MDLIRRILLEVERNNGISSEQHPFDDVDRKVLTGHVEILLDAGYVEGSANRLMGGRPPFVVRRLTWQGHEFLDAARDDTVWNKAKGRAAAVGGVSIAVMKELLIAVAKEKLGLQ